jgi:hypothetical protein
MSTNDKTDSGTPGGTGGTAATKTDTTASAKVAAKKKHQQQQQKSQKSNQPAAKKKQQPKVVKSIFEGNASGVSPMKGIIVAHGRGNMAGLFRVFQEKLAGSAADDKAYGLDSSILDLVAKVKSDFVKPKPSPLSHSNLVTIYEKDDTGANTKVATGEKRLVCFNPILKEEMEAEYNMDLKIQKSNWNQFERHYEGYYRIAFGNIEDTVITYCRADSRMALIEANKDLVGLLLVLRAVCAQDDGGVKVDREYHNLSTLHSVLGYQQRPADNDHKFAKAVADRYGSALFTMGKYAICGTSVHEKVLETYPTSSGSPMSFNDYLNLSVKEQTPIDDIVKQRTVARLIVKNSLNDKLRAHLITVFATGDECYPNTVSDALSLLTTFAKTRKEAAAEDAMVSYHETAEEVDIVENDDDVHEDSEPIHNGPDETIDHDNGTTDTTINDAADPPDVHVSFSEHVMASIIAEATADDDEDHFIGASFALLQEVDDAYEDDEPDLVCCAHVVDPEDDKGVDVPDFVTDANNLAQEQNKRIASRTATITKHSDFLKDFELMVYHTAQRIMHKSSQTVGIFHYAPGRPELISHTYGPRVPESIIDYSDVLRYKLKKAGIHDNTTLMSILSSRTDVDAMTALKVKFNAVGLKGINTSTVKILREETNRSLEHLEFNCHRYHNMKMEIGADSMMMTFPVNNTLLHHVVSCVAIAQDRRKPNRWVNKITQKLIDANIESIATLQSKIDDGSLNDHIDDHGLPRLHDITINGFIQIMGGEDFRQGRS